MFVLPFVTPTSPWIREDPNVRDDIQLKVWAW